jgi:integrase
MSETTDIQWTATPAVLTAEQLAILAPLFKVRYNGLVPGATHNPWIGCSKAALALHAEYEDAAALAAVLCLTCGGLRPIEAASLMTRDIDGGGAFLWIRASKTRSGVRKVPVPEGLRPALLLQAQRAKDWAREQDPAPLVPPLFPPVRLAGSPGNLQATGPTLSTESLRRAVHRVCRAVGLRLVTTYSLRGLFASLSYEGGEAPARVAALMGHSSPAVTQRHYATEDAQMAGRAERAERAFDFKITDEE